MILDNSMVGVKVKKSGVTLANGVRVKKNNVINTVWEASKPWEAYSCDGSTLTANSPAKTPVGSGTVYSAAGQYMWYVSGSDALWIKTQNTDGTDFLPTQGCKYMDVIVRADAVHQTTCIVTGKKYDGTESVILTKTIPTAGNNKNNIVDGVTIDLYAHNITNISVKGYASVKVEHYCNVTGSGHSVGLGRLVFHD